MTRGQVSEVGETRTSANGYHYTRTEDGWRLTHHLIAEKQLGRRLKEDERVSFKDKNKKNLDPDNIVVNLQGRSSLHRRKAQLEARIEELKAELAALEEEILSNKLR